MSESRFPELLKTLEAKREEGAIRKDSHALQAGGRGFESRHVHQVSSFQQNSAGVCPGYHLLLKQVLSNRGLCAHALHVIIFQAFTALCSSTHSSIPSPSRSNPAFRLGKPRSARNLVHWLGTTLLLVPSSGPFASVARREGGCRAIETSVGSFPPSGCPRVRR